MNRRTIAISSTVLAGALILGSAGAALAADNGSGKAPGFGHSRGHDGMHNGPLQALLQNGTITQADLDAVKSALKANHDSNRTEHEAQRKADQAAVLSDLVKKGTLTQAQADAIAAADRGGLRTLIDNGTVTRDQVKAFLVLNDLVSKGTLTQAKADAIAAALAAPGRDPGVGHRGGHVGGRTGR